MLYHLLYPLHEQFALFNVFRYITFRTAGAIVTAILLALLLGPRFIATLRRLSVAPAAQASQKAVQAGQSVFGEEVVSRLPSLLSQQREPDFSEFDIRPKEMELIALVAEGLNNREIADRLHLGEGTVRNSLSLVLEKLGLRDRTQLAILYHKRRRGLDG